jgi:hypothetical protein
MPIDISFFMTAPKPKRKPKPPPSRTASNKREQAAIRTYFQASADERKAILHAQAAKEQKERLIARRAWRRGYQRQYRAMAAMATVII